MLTQDFINSTLPLLSSNDTVKKALQIMKDFRLEHLTVCINGKYGFLSYDNLHLLADSTPLSKIEQLLSHAHLSTKDHIWVSIGKFNQYDTDTLPLLDEKLNYCGAVLLKDIYSRASEVFPIGNGGAIIELEIAYQHYSIHELGSIVEGANAKIMLLSVFPIKGTSKVNVIFSIDKNDATDVIQSLERHSYHVNAWYMNKGKIDNILEDRYDAFMQYINV